VKRSDDIVMIQITLNQRTQAVKVALYEAIADSRRIPVSDLAMYSFRWYPLRPRTGRSATAKRSTSKPILPSGS